MNPAQTQFVSPLSVSVGVECHVGSVRDENQDRISRASTPYGDLYVVADGVGGYRGGAEAAQAVVDGFARELNAGSQLPVEEALQAAAERINRELEERATAQDPPSKMGSTVVIALIQGSTATIAHVGDSRAYLVRGSKLQQITSDHSVVQRLIDEGAMGEADARDHASASVLTQALGQSDEIEMSIARLQLQPGDALLLCSDGLWGYASDVEMEAIAASPDLSPQVCADVLLHLALQGGGGDNISVQYLRFSAAVPPARRRTLMWGTRLSTAVPIAGGLLAALALAAGLTAWNYKHGALPATTGAERTQATLAVIDDNGGRAAWATRLSALTYLKTVVVEADAGCRALEQSGDTLYFKPTAAATAEHIRTDLGIPSGSMRHLAPESSACGAGDVFVVPAVPLK